MSHSPEGDDPGKSPTGDNIAGWLRLRAGQTPDKPALYFSSPSARGTYEHRTYRQVDEGSDAYARGLQRLGVIRGSKVILLIRPGPELFLVIFALFKLGAVAVVVDPGMGLDRMLHCYRAAAADAFIGIPVAHGVRLLHPGSFRTLKTLVTVGRRWLWGGHRLEDIAESGAPFPLAQVRADELLIINFTTGSTGPAKGVEYSHGTAQAMLSTIAGHFGQGPEDVSLVTLTLLGVFDLMLGSTVVLAPMDPSRPASVDARRMIDALAAFGVTHMFASPAFLHRVGSYAEAHGLRLPSLRRVIAGGAPVSLSILERFHGLLDGEARMHVTYGATEALPIASIDAREILGETAAETRAGRGSCVGRPLGDLEARTILITEDAIARWTEELEAPAGDVGEIVLRGAIVSRRYHDNPRADAQTKIADPAGAWHRTGDLGWIDERGRIWVCGRKSQRVMTADGPQFTVQWEGVFNAHPAVYRSALVGVAEGGAPKEPVVCVELRERLDAAGRRRLEGELLAMARANPRVSGARTFLVHPGFPVDVRHNAKIDREELSAWAEARLGVPGEGTARERRGRWLWAVPIGGWLLVIYGALWPFQHPLLRAIWLIDLFLSVVVHGVQLVVALPVARRAGHGVVQAVLLTFLLGATWWRPLRARGQRSS